MQILVVDDDDEFAAAAVAMLGAQLALGEAHVERAASVAEALARLARDDVDVVVLDYLLTDGTGLDVLRAIRARGATTAAIVLTGAGGEQVAVAAMKAGAADYLSKSRITPAALTAAVRYAAALRRRDQALREAESRYRALVESSLAGVYVARDDRFAYVNPRMAEIFGYAPGELVALRSLEDLARPEEREAVADAARASARERTRFAFAGVHRDGRAIDVEVHAAPAEYDGAAAVVGMVLDVSDRRRLEDKLHRAQQLEAIGRLAGGIAHDFNNLLTAILGYADFARAELGDGHPLASDLDQIHAAGERAATLTRQLLAFSRRQLLQPQVLDVNAHVATVAAMLRRLIGEDVVVELRLASDLGRVEADPGQIEQVIMNLAVNARDAMPEGGRLVIETANVEFGASASLTEGARPGRYAMLAVSDTGVGMDAATRARIFEPFFSTKEQGRGTGLGLATVYGVVEQSGGWIAVDTAPGQGSTFRIYLPRVERPPRSASHRGVAPPPRGTETVLVVEDEDGVRALATRALAACGYRVLDARNAEEALALADGFDGAIHLVLTDVVMPGASGRRLVEQLAARRPAMSVLYMSGYTDDAIVRHGVLDEGTRLLPKPFTTETLVRAVREALDALGAPGGAS